MTLRLTPRERKLLVLALHLAESWESSLASSVDYDTNIYGSLKGEDKKTVLACRRNIQAFGKLRARLSHD